jgi:hypothetical protein
MQTCDQHPVIEARLQRIERILYILMGLGLGTGLLQIGQVIGYA